MGERPRNARREPEAEAASGIAVFVLDDRGAVSSCNDAARELLTRADADVLRRRLADPEALAAARAGLAPHSRVGLNGSAGTIWLSVLGGGERDLLAVATLEPDAPASAGFHRWFDEAPAMVGYLDGEGRFLTVNRQLAERLGYTLAELRQRRLIDLVSETDRELRAGELSAAFAGSLPAMTELRLRARDGQSVDVELATSPRRAEGERSGVVVLLRDVGDRRQREAEAERYTHELEQLFVQLERQTDELRTANEQIRQARLQTLQAEELTRLERLKTAFLDVAAHELRTPVTLLNGILDLLRGEPDADIKTMLHEAAKRSTARLSGIIDSALKLLHSERRAPTAPFRLQSLTAVLEAACADVAAFLELRSQRIDRRLPESLPEVELDASMIRDVTVNLLMNAIKFTPDGGVITVSAERSEPGWVSFHVADTGRGIPAEDLPHIFDGFFCSLDTMHHSSGLYEYNTRGPGLGLAIVQRFIQHHGGAVDVRTAPDAGTTFTVRLPERQAPRL